MDKNSQRSPSQNSDQSLNTQDIDLLNLPQSERQILSWIRHHGDCTLADVATQIGKNEIQTLQLLDPLEQKGFLGRKKVGTSVYYHIALGEKNIQKKSSQNLFKSFENIFGKLTFSILIILFFITVALLIPFVVSPIYLERLREKAFELYQLFQGDIYKQVTGYSALFFVFLEMIFTARKRGRGWLIKLKIPGSMLLWRSLHVFLGVALVGVVLIHTVGSTGLNFNAIFLWIFFGVTLSALVGVVTETGVLEYPRRYIGSSPNSNSIIPSIKKGAFIRGWREWWLGTHIFLVSVFFVMLGFHIFLAYYYQ